MRVRELLTSTALITCLAVPGGVVGEEMAVKITPEIGSVPVVHNGKEITVMRNQDENAAINPAFTQTSRKCPPFCIQPARLAPGVETIGEVEMLDYLKRMSDGDTSILVLDSRTPDWVAKGTIPGARNLAWNTADDPQGTTTGEIAKLLESEFGVEIQEGLWDFSKAKTLVMFCNGVWCDETSANIKTLLKFGYPAHKLNWYRGGMQDWETLGLTTVKP